MTRVADEGNRVVRPERQAFMLPELPLAQFAVGNEVEHFPHFRAEVVENLEHLRFAPCGGVGRRGRGGEILIGLCGAEVVNLVIGDGVRDDVAFGADPTGGAVGVEEGEEVGVVGELGAGEHDSVGGLAAVDDFRGSLVDFEELVADRGFDAVRCEEDVGRDEVGGAFAGEGGERGSVVRGLEGSSGCGEEESDALFALTAFV